MLLVPESPRAVVRVRVGAETIEHLKDTVREYPDELGKELLKDPRNRFRLATPEEEEAYKAGQKRKPKKNA